MSFLKARVSNSMCRMVTTPVVPSSQMLVSNKISLTISHSVPSPPPGAEPPYAAWRELCFEPSSTLARMLNFQLAMLLTVMRSGRVSTVEFNSVMWLFNCQKVLKKAIG
jgi:hypothetical protein